MSTAESGRPAPVPAPDPDPDPVTVLGLGAMGTALARAFLAAGHPTTVWNRTRARAEPLTASATGGSSAPTVAPTVTAAVEASPLVVACLLDHDAVRAVLEPVAPALRGRTLVNLTSSTPEQARRAAEWARRHEIAYLDGAIMVTTPMVGTADSYILYSGSRTAFDTHRASLTALAADSDHLGEDAGLAATYDLAMLDLYFAGMTGFLHAAALVTADGVSAKAFLPYAQRMVGLLEPTIAGLAAEVDAAEHPGEEDNLVMELAVADHIVAASTERGIDTGPPEVVRSLLRRGVEQGHGRDTFSRLIDLLRRPAT